MKSRPKPAPRPALGRFRPEILASLILATSASAVQHSYQYYRFTPTKLRNDLTANSIQLSEFDFLLNGALLSRTGVTATNPGGNTPANEVPARLIDGLTNTKMLDFYKSHVVFDFGAATTIDGYRFTTANDATERDPVRWIFEGSADGLTWTLLDHQISDFATPTGRQTATSNILLPDTPAPFLYTWTGASPVDWDSTTANWDNGIWDNTRLLHARISGASPVTINLTEPVTTRVLETPAGSALIQGGSLSFSSIRAAGAGAPGIINNAPLAISSPFTGLAGFVKSGSGDLALQGANTYVGQTTIVDGSVSYAPGSSYNPASSTNLRVGNAAGRGVVNVASTGIFKFGHTRLGGDDVATHTGKGALNVSSGDVTLSGNYLELGAGVGAGGALTDTYGSFLLTGGKLTISGTGTRVGCGGLGSFVQSGGEYVAGNFFVIGGSTGAASFGRGVATFTGGTATPAGGSRILICDRENNSGTLNVGTLAGGNAVITTNNTGGPSSSSVVLLANTKGASAIANLNGGTLRFSGGGIARNGTEAGKTAAVHLNGVTLQANSATPRDLIVQNAAMPVRLFNGGLTVDTQAFNATLSASLLAPTGNGIYPAGGILGMTAPDGAGYIGAPLVTVTTSGAGTGASAIANVSNGQVTGVTLTCPGEGYLAGDSVTFTFAGGGYTTASAPFVHTLGSGDLAANGTGGLAKLGSGTLSLTGTNTFSGPLSITGKLDSNNLTLNNVPLTFNNFVPDESQAPLKGNLSLTTGGVVPVVVNGTFAVGDWPLISYPPGGSIPGSGIGALQLQTALLPRGVEATLVDNPAEGAVQLSVTAVNSLTWKGTTDNQWDIDTTVNWTLGADPETYLNGDVVLFNDSVGVGPTGVELDVAVSPATVTFDNDTIDYTLSGSGGISGAALLNKSNNGTVTLLTANTFTGPTTVTGGTLQLGDGAVNGSIAGPLVNNTTVMFTPAGSSTLPGNISGAGTFVKTAPGTQILTGANAFTGIFQVEEGTLQLGDGSVNGSPGTSIYEVSAGASLRFDRATAATPPWAVISGAGTVTLDSAQAVNGSAAWGPLALPPSFTGTLRVENGRVDANGGSTALGGTSAIEILPGAQFLGFSSAAPYTTPITIAGNGWGENGWPGGLRLAADSTATWEGSVTLTADSGIMAQRGSNFMVTGPISGSYLCEFYAGDPSADSGTLTIAPAVPVQNSYASTRINGRPNASIVAGNVHAFSSGPLTVDNAILKLNGNDLSFASLSGAGGAIGNYHATTPATLTAGSDGSSTSYAGVLRDGDAAPLALFKTGTGTLTLTAAHTYTGSTTVNQGRLVIASPYLADTSAVAIGSGAVIELNTGAPDTVGSLVLGGTPVGPDTYNSSHPVYGAYFSGTGSLVVGGAFESWAASKGLDGTPGKENGLEDDPEKDGIANLTEFYLDGDPLASDPSILPAGSVDNTYLTLVFSRRDDAEAYVTSQSVQHGSSLASWINAVVGAADSTDGNGVIVTVVENDADPDDITVQIPRTLAVGGRLFGRLQVIK